MFYFTPLPGFFSPFPHGTSSLSVDYLYLALRGGPRRFTPAFPDPVLLGNTEQSLFSFRLQGYYLLWRTFPMCFC